MYSGCKMNKYVFWSVVDFSFEKDTIGHIFTGQYYGLHTHNIYIIVKLFLKKKFEDTKNGNQKPEQTIQ